MLWYLLLTSLLQYSLADTENTVSDDCIVTISTTIPGDFPAVYNKKEACKERFQLKIKLNNPNNLDHIKSLSEEIWNEITTFEITNADIQEFPKQLINAKRIQRVNLSYNKITTIPDLSKLAKLQTFDLSHNLINSTIFMSNFENISELNLSNNHISELKNSSVPLNQLFRLEIINLSNNDIKMIPEYVFENCVNLKELDLSHNSIDGTFVITQFQGLSKLEKLSLSHNHVKDLGEGAQKFEHLQELYLDFNNISFLSNFIFKVMRNLKILNLSFNRITNVEENTFENLIDLLKLNLRNTSMMMIGKELFKNNINLAKLDISNNNITTIEPKSFINNKITELKLNNNHLKGSLDGNIFAGLLISELDLSNQHITEIKPKCFDFLSSLKHLNLNQNNITLIHEKTFAKLKVLETLDLSNNSITEPPGDIFKTLPSLSELNLSDNGIRKFESYAFDQSQGLKSLKCSNCKLEIINKEAFSKTTSLEQIDLSDNSLKNIDFIKNLSMLTTINLARNHLENIAVDVFSHLVSAKVIDLSSNEKLIINNHFEKLNLIQSVNLSKLKEVNFATVQNTSIKKLDLSACKIEDLNLVHVHNIKNLENLLLQNNNISVLCIDSLKTIGSLKQLNLNGNKISNLADNCFGGFTQLQTLSLSENKITVLKKSALLDLKNLNHLNLSSNKISTLKSECFILNTQLNTLDLQGNQINILFKDSFVGLNRLKVLNLGQNKLKNFGIWYLPSNKSEVKIILDDNLIDYINFEEFSQTKVKSISFRGNPILCQTVREAKLKYPNFFNKADSDTCVYEKSTLVPPTEIIISNTNHSVIPTVVVGRPTITHNKNRTTSAIGNNTRLILNKIDELKTQVENVKENEIEMMSLVKETGSVKSFKGLMYFIVIALGIIAIVAIVKLCKCMSFS